MQNPLFFVPRQYYALEYKNGTHTNISFQLPFASSIIYVAAMKNLELRLLKVRCQQQKEKKRGRTAEFRFGLHTIVIPAVTSMLLFKKRSRKWTMFQPKTKSLHKKTVERVQQNNENKTPTCRGDADPLGATASSGTATDGETTP